MALLGKGAIAMWWDIAPERRAEFEDWHSHEHFPERMSIPGFLRGARWAAVDGGVGFFVMYELEAYETLVSEGYLKRLNTPSPWSMRMMPHHGNVAWGYDRAVLEHLAQAEFGEGALVAAGARAGAIRGLYNLSHNNTAGDIG